VGHDDKVIGQATVTKQLDKLSTITFSHPGRKQLNEFSFSLPVDPRTERKLEGNAWPNVWETLEKLPEGTVGELAFSTTSFMESKQLIESLRKYDINILWMPLYTGEFIDFDPSGWGSSYNSIIIYDLIGLTGGNEHDKKYHESLRINRLDEDSLTESEQSMVKNMEELLNKSQSYYEQFLGLGHLEQKYQYLKKKGFTVYGAVVTGPVKELLKLQNVSFIQGEQLGEVELWNWKSENKE